VTTCPSTYFTYTSFCFTDCPSGTHGDTSTWICTACPLNCLDCTATECTKCDSGYGAVANTCVNPCPTGQYISPISTLCTGCDSTCDTCSGSDATDCLTCPTGTSLMPNGTCSSGCGTGTFLNGATATCETCDSTCLSCINGSANGCISCASGLLYDINNTQCLTICDPATQAIDEQQMNCWTCEAPYQPMGSSCSMCYKSCISCSG
jgi:proprotein convertase subtilisin/kexin type 5